MIGKLTGTVDEIGEDGLILDVNGVGYRVHCGPRTLAHMPHEGARVSLAIETVVREDDIRLYGFETAAERQWFRALQSVQGVGAKVALAILGTLGPAELARAVLFADKAMVARSPGVGPKLALRIVTELKDRAPAGPVADLNGHAAPIALEHNGALADALSALVNLGYAHSDAARALSVAAQANGHGDIAALIRAGLKELGR